jgi:uncharacterized membrane protein HdeD (DUF308 family)
MYAKRHSLRTYRNVSPLSGLWLLSSGRPSPTGLRVNAGISAAAVVAIAATAFGSDAGATMKSFGAWAIVSGVVLLGMAIRRRRSTGGQLPLIVSGGLSSIAGLSFILQSGGHNAHLTSIGGYMAFGALLYLLWAFRSQRQMASKR